MSVAISVAGELTEKVAEFVEAESLDWQILGETEEAPVRVIQGEDKPQCKPSLLLVGGWIACPDAFAMAKKLGVQNGIIGKFFNHMDVKMRNCQLGCF